MAEKRSHHPGIDAWAPWSICQVTLRIADLNRPWCLAGGCALDVWRGWQSREHDDIEIAILRSDWSVIASRLGGTRHFGAAQGQLEELSQGNELPSHINQIWVADQAEDVWRLEVLLEPGDDETWVFRRNPEVRRQRQLMIAQSADGVAYLKPEGVFLYKAKDSRPKDEADFWESVGLMTPESRQWLREALQRSHRGHSWIDMLA